MTAYRKISITFGIAVLGLSALIAAALLAHGKLTLVLACLLVLAALVVIFAFSRSSALSLRRLASLAETAMGMLHLRDMDLSASVSGETEEIRILETAIQEMAKELQARGEQIEAEGRRLKAILNGMSEAVLAVDGRLALCLANPCARQLFGINEECLFANGSTNGNTNVAAGALSLLAATRSTELENITRRVLNEGQSLEVELSLHSHNPAATAEQRFHVVAMPLSQPAGVVMVMDDITRLARLEQVRKDFIANVSHELRTPIQLIKGYSETMLDEHNLSEQFRRCMEIIKKNAGTMENLTNDLLVLSSLENKTNRAGMMEEQALAPLIAEAAAAVEPQAKKRKIEIFWNCSADLRATVHGSFIIQALINLIDNGIKYSPKKTRLWISAFRDNGSIVFAVKDEGIGITAEHLERIFERFYRVDRAHSRETGGTGLGLSIVRHIALLHNGTAEVESHAGEGSVFKIRIPAR